MVAAPRRHQVVDNSAVLAEQHRIAQPPVLQGLKVAGKQGFERPIEIGAAEQQLPHMADVEQAGVGPGPQMFRHDAFILDRHVIARERHHSAALGAMPCVERQGLGRFVGFGHAACPRKPVAGTHESTDGWIRAPFCRGDLRAFPRAMGAGLPLRWLPRTSESAFQTVGQARSLCLRDSGGGCSFGVAVRLPGRKLSRARLPRALRTCGDGAAVAARRPAVNAVWGVLARRVVAKLLLGQLESDQMLERGAGDRGAHVRG